jgi:diguanylate cyclase (GGDEF)-like protein
VKRRATLRRQSIVDALTGMYNRRYMDETLRRELLRAERKNGRLSITMSGLDHFKRINDTYGHDAGDALLKSVAQVIWLAVSAARKWR